MDDEDGMLSIGDVALRLRISERTVRRLIKSGAIRVTCVGRQYRFMDEWIEEFVTNNEKGNSDE